MSDKALKTPLPLYSKFISKFSVWSATGHKIAVPQNINYSQENAHGGGKRTMACSDLTTAAIFYMTYNRSTPWNISYKFLTAEFFKFSYF